MSMFPSFLSGFVGGFAGVLWGTAVVEANMGHNSQLETTKRSLEFWMSKNNELEAELKRLKKEPDS